MTTVVSKETFRAIHPVHDSLDAKLNKRPPAESMVARFQDPARKQQPRCPTAEVFWAQLEAIAARPEQTKARPSAIPPPKSVMPLIGITYTPRSLHCELFHAQGKAKFPNVNVGDFARINGAACFACCPKRSRETTDARHIHQIQDLRCKNCGRNSKHTGCRHQTRMSPSGVCKL